MHKHYSCAFIDVLVMCKLDIPVLPFPTRTVYNRTFNNYEQNMKNMYTTVSSLIKCQISNNKDLFQAYQFFGKMVLAPIVIAHMFTALICVKIGNNLVISLTHHYDRKTLGMIICRMVTTELLTLL